MLHDRLAKIFAPEQSIVDVAFEMAKKHRLDINVLKSLWDQKIFRNEAVNSSSQTDEESEEPSAPQSRRCDFRDYREVEKEAAVKAARSRRQDRASWMLQYMENQTINKSADQSTSQSIDHSYCQRSFSWVLGLPNWCGPGPRLVLVLGTHWLGPWASIDLDPGPTLVWAPGLHWFGPWAHIGSGPGPALVPPQRHG